MTELHIKHYPDSATDEEIEQDVLSRWRNGWRVSKICVAQSNITGAGKLVIWYRSWWMKAWVKFRGWFKEKVLGANGEVKL